MRASATRAPSPYTAGTQHVSALSAEQLDANFAEIAPPLTPDAAMLEANKCLYCYDAPCTQACPTHIDVPSFIKKIASTNTRGAARVILDANPMGHSCARACPVEVLCEGACVLNARDEQPIRIALLQRHATDWALEHEYQPFKAGPARPGKVAIVGGGPAGLSCARDLRRFGYGVTVFDERPEPGGLNSFGIAEYKMRQPLALAEAKMVLDLGVEVRSNVRVGRDVTMAQLLAGFDAVFVAVGLGATRRLGIPGEDRAGVSDALAFIEHLKAHPYSKTRVGRRVVVVGAGNTAIDAATQARRLGAERVTLVYRRGAEDMSAYDYEYELAKQDGCEFRFNTVPKQVLGGETVTGIECVRSELGPAGADGKRVFTEVAGSTHVIECDTILRALGQTPRADDANALGLRVDGARMVSDNPRILVGGDCGNGGAEIVNAAAEGVHAAKCIHELLSQ
ncbi:MAG TPA: NAD(P)-dependent oxidoreductase [Gemmatimonadaceae bacterium]|nr:NAD(P)-dependent oxidoreductase [Gemmatimonadaceae bacterium]